MKKIFTILTASTLSLALNAQTYIEDDFQGAVLGSNNAWNVQEISNPDAVPGWDLASFSGNGFAKVSAYNGGTGHDLNTWMISPAIDLSTGTTIDCSFDNVLRYGAGAGANDIIVHISTDYDGTSNPTMQGSWTDITSLFTLDTDESSWTFINSGVADISSYISATTYLAFEYVSTAADSPTWEIDNLLIEENGSIVAPPTITSIYDIQYSTDVSGDSPEVDNIVTTRGIVTGVVQIGSATGTFFIQDGDGMWNGIYIYESATAVNVGDSVFVTGTVLEYFTYTEIGSVTDITVINSGNTSPTPMIVTGTSVNDEAYEGVLVTVEAGINTVLTDQYGVWTINDGANVLIDDDLMAASFTSVIGNAYDVTGVRHFSFDEVKVLPRDMSDIITVGFNSISDNEISFNVYPNPATNNITVSGVEIGNVIIYAVNGEIVYSGIVNGKSIINVESFMNGIYFVEIIENNNKVNYKLIVE